MAGKKQSFRDILRNSFPVNVDGLLGGVEEEHSEKGAISSSDTVSLEDTGTHGATVSDDATVSSPVSVAPLHTVSRPDTVSSLVTAPPLDPVLPSEQVELTSNYFPIDADVFDLLPKVQTLFEQVVYRYLYRESFGRKRRTCFVGLKTLTEICQLSKNTVRKALEGLEEKGHIHRVERFNERDHKGTIYRVFLPCEISGLQSRTTFTLIAD